MLWWCACNGPVAKDGEVAILAAEGYTSKPSTIIIEGDTPSTAASPSRTSGLGPDESPSAESPAHPGAAGRSTDGAVTPADVGGILSALTLSPSVKQAAFERLPQDIQEELEEADRLRRTGYPFVAEAKVYALLQRLQKEDRADYVGDVKVSQACRDIERHMSGVNSTLEALLDDVGWTLQKESDGVHVWTRAEAGTDLVTVRMAGIVEGPFDYFCAIGKEVQHVKTWMPGVKTSYVVAKIGEFDQVGYYCWKYPFITGREFLIEEATHINDEEGYCVVRRSPPSAREDVKLPELTKSTIRASISNWCSFTAPVGKGTNGKEMNFAVSIMNVDLKIPLPTRLLNHLSVSVGYQSFQMLRQNLKKAQEASSPYHASLADPENAAYYQRMRELQKARERHPITCLNEILKTGWVKDPAERRRIFARSEGVLVPMAS